MSAGPLFVFTAQGVAGAASGYPAGERHALLIFVAAADPDAADIEAVARVEAEGWNGVTLMRRGTLAADPDLIANETLRPTARSALRDGCAFVVYADPIPHDA